MRRILICLPLAGVLAETGCSDMSSEQQRTLSGGAIGAAAGTAIGAIAGHTVWGLALGTAAGAAGGFLYNKYKQSE